MGTELALAAEKNPILETDPVAYMEIALTQAKEWLSQAVKLEDVRETRALAVGYESVLREKDCAEEAQLSAAEIIRRCERRIAELVREGQSSGTILVRGQNHHHARRHDDAPIAPHVAMGASGPARRIVHESYALADAPEPEFERAITEAREEGNLSRANVIRKIKGDDEPDNRPIGLRRRTPVEVVDHLVKMVRPLPLILETVDWEAAFASKSAPLDEWDEQLTGAIVALTRLRKAIRGAERF